MEEIDYESWALCLCALLDEIELQGGHRPRIRHLLSKRFEIAEAHGLKVEYQAPDGNLWQ